MVPLTPTKQRENWSGEQGRRRKKVKATCKEEWEFAMPAIWKGKEQNVILYLNFLDFLITIACSVLFIFLELKEACSVSAASLMSGLALNISMFIIPHTEFCWFLQTLPAAFAFVQQTILCPTEATSPNIMLFVKLVLQKMFDCWVEIVRTRKQKGQEVVSLSPTGDRGAGLGAGLDTALSDRVFSVPTFQSSDSETTLMSVWLE
jgi:hypothetical protein